MLIVKKFGGTSVADKEHIFNAARRCLEDYNKGNDVVVVLSAMGKHTDELIAQAKIINPNPSQREMDMLLTAGEQISISLLAMAIESLGYPVISLLGWQAGFNTNSSYGSARIREVKTERLEKELADAVNDIWSGTFHSVCLRILRKYGCYLFIIVSYQYLRHSNLSIKLLFFIIISQNYPQCNR